MQYTALHLEGSGLFSDSPEDKWLRTGSPDASDNTPDLHQMSVFILGSITVMGHHVSKYLENICKRP